MPGSYSTDLRRRAVAAVLERGERPEAVARRFVEVGRSTVYRWVGAAREEGRFEAKPRRGGPEPVIRDGVEAALVRLVAADNDRTLSEYADRLAAEAGVRVHPWTVRRPGAQAARLDAQKRRPCAPANGIGPIASRRVRAGGRRPPGSTRRAWSSSMRARR